MREYKFRAWDKENKVMEDWESLLEQPAHHLFTRDDLLLMQFTGLKDKNGKEIYEADILRIVTEDGKEIEAVCEFGVARRTMGSGWEVDIPSFYFRRGDGLKSFPIVKNWAGKHDLEIIEVIGNIWENGDLLKESK